MEGELRYCTFQLNSTASAAPGRVEGDEVVRLEAATLLDVLTMPRPPADGPRYPLSAVRLLAPIPRPPSIRDFFAFEQHVATARANRGSQVPKEWYEFPVFYFTNPAAVYGPDDDIPYPAGTRELDYELEIAAVIGHDGGIAGFTVMNDWSARDIQRKEMRVGLGPAKAKDFATSLGPVLVTADEFDGTSRAHDRQSQRRAALARERRRPALHVAADRRAGRSQHPPVPRRRDRLRHGRHRLHPRARRRTLADQR
jgi:fumarylacetoacetate (FAA) hydrolase